MIGNSPRGRSGFLLRIALAIFAFGGFLYFITIF